MSKSYFLFFCLCLIVWSNTIKGQESTIETIQTQPAPEAYDLLKDSKGYLWLAHDLGVSRYDGSSFIHLNSPYQNSIAMTDLVEDKQGRIWCHNFTGQIFYIEKLKLHLLTQYKFEEERGFPRIVICGDELIATSIKGLFVYNILTRQSKYYSIPGGTKSLAQIGKKVICYGMLGWYSYEAGQSIRQLSCGLRFDNFHAPTLQPNSYKDTFYLIVNPISTYYKLTLDGSTIKVHTENKTTAFLNTISVDGDNIWVHTKNNSFTTDGKDVIDGMNLSDVVTESAGYKWMSSLKEGLCVRYNTQQIKKLNMAALSPGDYIRRVHTEGNHIFLTTANGKLYELNNGSSLNYILSIPKTAGIIDRITSIGPNQFLLAASVGLYLYDSKTRQLKHVDPSYTMKDIVVHKGKLYIASSIGIRYCTLEQLTNKRFPFEKGGLFNKEVRCKSIAFAGDSLMVAYSDGLFIGSNNTLRPILYKQRPIYASKIKTISGKILVGTYNQGLLIIENGRIKNITENDGLISNNIQDIKISSGRAWIVYYNDFQQLNHTLTGIEDAASYIPSIGGINDFGVLDSNLYVSTNEGMYRMKMTGPSSNITATTYIDRVMANGKELVSNIKLKHFQNHLQFHISTPLYTPRSKIIYQYRIKNAFDSTWQTGAPGQSVFNVIALEPGVYAFEIVATDKNKKIISRPALYRFEIEKPWFQTWTFRIALGIALAAFIFYFIRHYFRSKLRKQRIEYEKILAVQTERQRISSEIHDDIGAGLSAIRLLTEITKNKMPESEVQKEVGKIHTSVSELSHKMREVIWSLNADNDYLENLLYYIQRQAIVLFENSPIQLKVSFPGQPIPDKVIRGDKRRHIYLAVKEALHNCLKHSEAKTCYLSMEIANSKLQIVVADDGIGFSPIERMQAGNGLANMRKRMDEINGYFEVHSASKTEVRFIVPLKLKS